MTANFRKPGLLYPTLSASTLPAPAPFIQRLRPADRRTHVPAKTHEHRKTRTAELAAWEATIPSDTAHLRAHVAEAAQNSLVEKWAFRIIMVLTLTGILWGLLDSFEFMAQWHQFVALIRNAIS
jgi:hypothetical protein